MAEEVMTERSGGVLIVTLNRPHVRNAINAATAEAIADAFSELAADNARFGLPEVKRGLVAAAGGLLRLPRQVPSHLAAEWALTGEYISAAEARAAGLVNRITPPGEALAQAFELAQRIARNGPLAVAATKRILAESPGWPLAEAFDRQREITEPVRGSQDAREGSRAFVEKREPHWQGR